MCWAVVFLMVSLMGVAWVAVHTALRKGSLPCITGPQFLYTLRYCCPWTIREGTGHTVVRNHNFLAS